MIAGAAVLTMAIVSQDALPLKAAANDKAPVQTMLWQGDVLEVRGRKLDYWQVYDHRHERAGYVPLSAVQSYELTPTQAPALAALWRFFRHQTGSETLGMAYVAAYLQAAPAPQIDGEVFAALGEMAERLAQRASKRKTTDTAIDAWIEIAASYGVKLVSFDSEGQVRLCYDGEAWRRVLALPAAPEDKAIAALGLTRHDCVDPALNPLDRYALDEWRAAVLDRVVLADLPDYWQNRVRLRRAGVWASVAFDRSRTGKDAAAATERALQELTAVNPAQLSESDKNAYQEAAIRVAAVRPSTPLPVTGLTVQLVQGSQVGERCLQVWEPKAQAAAVQHCSYGNIKLDSLRVNPSQTAITVAVQPLAGWRELWVLSKQAQGGWQWAVLPPAETSPELGYIEFAGWVPQGQQFLVVRESRSNGRYQRSFELVRLADLVTEKKADHPEAISTFYRWQEPIWRKETLSLR